MNIIDIVKSAPESAERYKVFDYENFTEYYAAINGVKSFHSVKENGWKECRSSSFSSSLLLPKLKTEWIKVEGSIWDLRPDFETGELYHKFEHARDFTKVENIETLAQAVNQGKCYRKVEKVVDEKREFIERASEVSDHHGPTVFGKLYDAGCRFVEAEK